MLGEEESSNDPRSFEQAKLYKRMCITLAGVFMNFVGAILLFSITFMIGTNPGLIFVSERDLAMAEEMGIMKIEVDEEGNRKVEQLKQVKMPVLEAIPFAVQRTVDISGHILTQIVAIPAHIVTEHELPKGMAGPVGIAEMTHKLAPMGILALMKWAALLSISLGVFNLLPLPALDGGRFVFQLYELIFQHKPNPRFENALHVAGFALLMLLILFVTWGDVVRLIA